MFFVALSLLACTQLSEPQARMAFLRDTLARDNAIWLNRDPELLEEKYEKMADDPFDFMRGASLFFYSDLARPDPRRSQTQFLTVPAASSILLAGDPHPENIGTCLPGQEPDVGDTPLPLIFEVQDLDGSGFGPYLLDVRRGALGMALLADSLKDCDCVIPMVQSFVSGYVTEIQNTSVDTSTACSDTQGAVVARLCEKATTDAPQFLTEIVDYSGDTPQFLLDTSLDKKGKGILALRPEEAQQLNRLLHHWTRQPLDFRVLAEARRFGVGVASFPAVRYVVLWDHGDPKPDDDHLLSLREVIDPPSPPGRGSTVPVLFDSNAARIEQVAWMLWSRPDADIHMAGISDGSSTFKITTWSGWFQGFDHQDIQDDWLEGLYQIEDLTAYAAMMGKVLADTHAHGITAEGAPALPTLVEDIHSQNEAFIEERLFDATNDLQQLYVDYNLFQEALDLYGPLLGVDTLVDDSTR